MNSKKTQRKTLEKIVRDFEAAPAQGNSMDQMIARTEYLLAKRMLASADHADGCIRKDGVDAKTGKQTKAQGAAGAGQSQSVVAALPRIGGN